MRAETTVFYELVDALSVYAEPARGLADQHPVHRTSVRIIRHASSIIGQAT